MRIYTRRGDGGETDLAGGRTAKHAERLESLGTLDELMATLGVATAHLAADDAARDFIQTIQRELFVVGAAGAGYPCGDAPEAARLEREIDAMEAELAPLRHFILPGGAPAGAQLHLARTVCRRLERLLSAEMANGPAGGAAKDTWAADHLKWVNRLSDHLFVLARLVNHRAGAAETIWRGRP